MQSLLNVSFLSSFVSRLRDYFSTYEREKYFSYISIFPTRFSVNVWEKEKVREGYFAERCVDFSVIHYNPSYLVYFKTVEKFFEWC